jgi:hypothetical protein
MPMPSSLIIQALRGDLAFVERELSSHPDPYDTVRLMWQQRKETLLQEIAQAEGHPDNFARVSLLFNGDPVRGSEEIRLDFATKALESYQSVIATVAATRAGELMTKGRLPGAFPSRLYIRDMMRGSVGFLIEEARPTQYLLMPSVLKESVDEATRIIDDLSKEDAPSFARRMTEINPRTVQAIKRLAKVLHDAGAETQIVADDAAVTLTQTNTTSLFLRLSDVQFVERHETSEGVLLGLFPERQQFEFRPTTDAPVFYGAVSEEFGARYLTDPSFARSIILQPVTATFLVIATTRGGSLQREERILEDVRPLPAGLNAGMGQGLITGR